jgi:hypothetical protein
MPEVRLQRHLVVEKYDEVLTQSEQIGDWTVARISRRHVETSIPVATEVGREFCSPPFIKDIIVDPFILVLPNWVFVPNSQTGNHQPVSADFQYVH